MSSIINNYHQIPRTVRKVKYTCKKEKIQQIAVYSNLLKQCVLNEIQTSWSSVGYRHMSEIGINISREKFCLTLKAVDHEGVAERGKTVIKQRIHKTKEHMKFI